MARILLIEDEETLRYTITRTLERVGHEVVEYDNVRGARERLETEVFDLVLTDVILGSDNGLLLVKQLREEGFEGVIVVMTAFSSVESAVQAMRDGADDYLQKPLSLEELDLQIGRWLEHRRLAQRVKLYERLEQQRAREEGLLGESVEWKRTLEIADRLATVPMPAGGSGAGGALPCILLLGETGTGKGLLARYIHERSIGHEEGVDPSAVPFVHVNCSALPASLVEGELFGHEKGAFTDAREARAGLFEMADGGTIFLDEISEMPLDLQAKLLLVVEQGSFRRVGGSRERTVRARVIAASNQDLGKRVEGGRFRQDLLYRLNAFTIEIPSLRDRTGDAVHIARRLLEQFAARAGREGMGLSPESEEAIARHWWPGNVRELANAVQRGLMLCSTSTLTPQDLALAPGKGAVTSPAFVSGSVGGTGGDRQGLVFDFENGVHRAADVERELIVQSLRHTGGNVSKAARLIGMQRSSFRYRIERYGLDPSQLELATP